MSVIEKQRSIVEVFSTLSSPDEKYTKIIEMGRQLPPISPAARIEKNLVPGCQSILYLETIIDNNLLYFHADSEALISKGLAALLIYAYSGEPPEALFKAPPTFLKEIGLHQALSPNRSNGLMSLYRKMQQDAIQAITDGKSLQEKDL